MSDHYYSSEPTSQSKPAQTAYQFKDQTLAFTTDAGVFSRGEMDAGTDLLLRFLPALQGRVLDLGCGWGAIGVTLKKAFPHLNITMTDINTRAAALAKANSEANGAKVTVKVGDGFEALAGETYDFVITNPPIRAGKQVIYDLFAASVTHLTPGGSLVLVIRKQQGAESAIKYLKTLYQTVAVLKKGGGFWIIQCIKGV